jgi:hypothetical protein
MNSLVLSLVLSMPPQAPPIALPPQAPMVIVRKEVRQEAIAPNPFRPRVVRFVQPTRSVRRSSGSC